MRATFGIRPARGARASRALLATVVAAGLVAGSAGAARGQTAPAPDGRDGARGGRPVPHDSAPVPYEPHVAIGVPGIDEHGFVELRGGTVPVEVANRRDRPVHVALAIDVQADGANIRAVPQEQALAPSGRARVDVPLAALGITLDRLRGPAVVTLRATTSDGAGNQIDGVVNPSLFLSAGTGGAVVLADEAHVLRTAKGRPGQQPGTINLFAGAAAGSFDPEAQPPERGSGLRAVCVHWQYASGDHNAGERYYAKGEPMAARGVMITVSQGGFKMTVHAGKQTGCTSVPLDGGKPAYAVVHPEAKVGTSGNITVRAKDASQPSTQGWLAAAKNWSFEFVPGDDASHLYVPAGRVSTLMAYGTFSVQRLDHEAPLVEPQIKRNLDLEYSTATTNSYAAASVVIASTQYDRKFVYGHEVGHWYSDKQSVDFGGPYSHASKVAACTSRNDKTKPELDHIMRSTEKSSAAFNEGLMHFFSSTVWNGPGWKTPMFRYYKDLSAAPDATIAAAYADFGTNHNRIDLAAASNAPLGGVRAWRDVMCGADDRQRYSVELDWARFVVNYLDGDLWWGDQPGDAPTFAQLIDHLRLAYKFFADAANNNQDYNSKVYWYLLQALQDDEMEAQHGFIERFRGFAWQYGVTLEAEK